MKRWLFLPALVILLAGCTQAAVEVTAVSPTNSAPSDTAVPENTPMPTELPPADLPDLGEAPEILNTVWINADEPVTIASQRGKVILLEFWTFG